MLSQSHWLKFISLKQLYDQLVITWAVIYWTCMHWLTLHTDTMQIMLYILWGNYALVSPLVMKEGLVFLNHHRMIYDTVNILRHDIWQDKHHIPLSGLLCTERSSQYRCLVQWEEQEEAWDEQKVMENDFGVINADTVSLFALYHTSVLVYLSEIIVLTEWGSGDRFKYTLHLKKSS